MVKRPYTVGIVVLETCLSHHFCLGECLHELAQKPSRLDAKAEEINDGTMWAKLLSLARDGHLLGMAGTICHGALVASYLWQ